MQQASLSKALKIDVVIIYNAKKLLLLLSNATDIPSLRNY